MRAADVRNQTREADESGGCKEPVTMRDTRGQDTLRDEKRRMRGTRRQMKGTRHDETRHARALLREAKRRGR